MIHEMRLKREPFDKISNGEKTIEMRLYDDKRQKISVGDQIVFILSDDESQTVCCLVTGLEIFDDFKTFYSSVDLTKAGYEREELSTASPEDMTQYYSEEKLKNFKALAIFVKVV